MATFPAVLFVVLKGVPVLTSGFPYQIWVCRSSFFSVFVLYISCTCSRKILGTCSGADVLNQMPFSSYIITSDQKQWDHTNACRQDFILPSCPGKQNLLCHHSSCRLFLKAFLIGVSCLLGSLLQLVLYVLLIHTIKL